MISEICKATAPQCPEIHSINTGPVNSCFLSSSWNVQSDKLCLATSMQMSSRIQNAKWLVHLHVVTSTTAWGTNLCILMQQGACDTPAHVGHRLWWQFWLLSLTSSFCLLLCSNSYLYFQCCFSPPLEEFGS